MTLFYIALAASFAAEGSCGSLNGLNATKQAETPPTVGGVGYGFPP